ncbi:MAG: hypothetical protein IJI14_12090 [Anaerolineaceae bacterium]|nr:hypothetical protein [Anaerolineaceae bacterium]
MRKLAEQALDMVNLLGCAMMCRKDLEQPEAKRYWKRLLQLICKSGFSETADAVYSATPEGKQLSEAAHLYVSLMVRKPDPEKLSPECCMSEMKAWYETVLLTAAGKQQSFEMKGTY